MKKRTVKKKKEKKSYNVFVRWNWKIFLRVSVRKPQLKAILPQFESFPFPNYNLVCHSFP